MTGRNVLLLTSAAIGLLAAPAGAASKKTAQPDWRAVAERQQRQIDSLQAQLDELRRNGGAAAGALAGGVAVDADAAAAAQAEADENAAREEFMLATMEAQQSQIDSLTKQVKQNAPAWKGAPEFKGSGGWSFKPNGLVQLDGGYVQNPKNAVNTVNLGWNTLFRRIGIGAEGSVPGGFKYKIQLNLAGAQVGFEDVMFSYEPEGKPFSAAFGYFFPYSNLENMTSNRFTSFTERAQLTDAFNEGRRIGVGLGYQTASVLLNAGIFNGTTINNNADNTAWSGNLRGVWFPKFGNAQYHAAVNFQYRNNNKSSLGANYSARPFTQVTNVRFVGTSPANNSGVTSGGIAAFGDTILGGELAGIWGPLHVAGEAQYVWVDAIQPGEVLSGGQAVPAGFVRLASDPNFFSAYGEVGYWFTGETRGYRAGRWDRTKIVHPFDKGGWGGLQAVARIDYLNLNNYVGASVPPSTLIVNGELNGGQQLGFLFALNWWPTDYVRFTSQYIHSEIHGGPLAATVDPTRPGATPVPLYDRNYGVNAFVMRAQIDW